MGRLTQRVRMTKVRLSTTMAAPEGTATEGTAPEGTVPEGTVPEGTVPEGTVPEGTVPAVSVFRAGEHHGEDTLAVEEPLEIRLGDVPFSVTMRTPGDDFDLVAGFLVSEGVIWEPGQLVSLRFCAGEDENGRQTFNVVQAQLRPDVEPPDTGLARHVYTTSSCGICGTASIDAVRKSSHFAPDASVPGAPLVGVELLASLPDKLRQRQKLFDRTGGVHAAGLFSAAGELLCLREDVGRHNAVDKVVGWALREGRLPLNSTVLQVSGRASFELVQKASLAGVPILAAVSAPSSLAVELAESSGLTLVGFSRGSSLNVYSHPERVLSQSIE